MLSQNNLLARRIGSIGIARDLEARNHRISIAIGVIDVEQPAPGVVGSKRQSKQPLFAAT